MTEKVWETLGYWTKVYLIAFYIYFILAKKRVYPTSKFPELIANMAQDFTKEIYRNELYSRVTRHPCFWEGFLISWSYYRGKKCPLICPWFPKDIPRLATFALEALYDLLLPPGPTPDTGTLQYAQRRVGSSYIKQYPFKPFPLLVQFGHTHHLVQRAFCATIGPTH